MLIAEIGNNHLGSEQRLVMFTSNLLSTPIDAITIQIREDEFYENPNVKHWRLEDKQYDRWFEYMRKSDKKSGLAVCKVEHVKRFDCDFYKILSKDFHNDELVSTAIETGKPVYISCGDVELQELNKWKRFDNVTYIHTQLSAEIDDVNLKAIDTMSDFIGKKVAFGLHSIAFDVLLLAIAKEPESIWFYVKQNGVRGQPDYNHAVPVEAVQNLTMKMKHLERAIGDGVKSKQERKIFNEPGQ